MITICCRRRSVGLSPPAPWHGPFLGMVYQWWLGMSCLQEGTWDPVQLWWIIGSWSFPTAELFFVLLCLIDYAVRLVIDRTSDIWLPHSQTGLATAPKKQNLSALNHQGCWSGITRTLRSFKNGMLGYTYIIIFDMLKFVWWCCFPCANRGLLSFFSGFSAPFASHHRSSPQSWPYLQESRSRETYVFCHMVVSIVMGVPQ